MVIKVISNNVIHNGESIGIGGVIKDIDEENAKRLCENGLCEVLFDVEVDGDISEAELHEEEIDLEKMTKAELIEYAENIGVEVDGDISEAELHEEEIDLEKMTKAELIEYAENIGVEVDGKDTKAKIIEKITQADMPATDIPTE